MRISLPSPSLFLSFLASSSHPLPFTPFSLFHPTLLSPLLFILHTPFNYFFFSLSLSRPPPMPFPSHPPPFPSCTYIYFTAYPSLLSCIFFPSFHFPSSSSFPSPSDLPSCLFVSLILSSFLPFHSHTLPFLLLLYFSSLLETSFSLISFLFSISILSFSSSVILSLSSSHFSTCFPLISFIPLFSSYSLSFLSSRNLIISSYHFSRRFPLILIPFSISLLTFSSFIIFYPVLIFPTFFQ